MKIKEKDDYIELLEAKQGPSGRPLSGQIDLTYRCNLKCQHCFIVREENKQELTFDEMKEKVLNRNL